MCRTYRDQFAVLFLVTFSHLVAVFPLHRRLVHKKWIAMQTCPPLFAPLQRPTVNQLKIWETYIYDIAAQTTTTRASNLNIGEPQRVTRILPPSRLFDGQWAAGPAPA